MSTEVGNWHNAHEQAFLHVCFFFFFGGEGGLTKHNITESRAVCAVHYRQVVLSSVAFSFLSPISVIILFRMIFFWQWYIYFSAPLRCLLINWSTLANSSGRTRTLPFAATCGKELWSQAAWFLSTLQCTLKSNLVMASQKHTNHSFHFGFLIF